jgi:methylmalonyl-CoA mutase C-terminal domain/subunit
VSEARRLRVLVTVLGLDQHEAGALAVSRILRDAGAEVVYAGRFNLPESIASAAVEEDVDAVAVSCHSWEFLYYSAQLVELLAEADPPIPVVLGGSVVTEADREQVLGAGVAACVLAGATPEEIVATFRQVVGRPAVS